MSALAIKREVAGDIESVLWKIEPALKEAGFGILTRIDFDQTIKEKLGAVIAKTVILGACNPKLAFAAYQNTTDAALLIPCNVVIRETSPGKVSVEAMRPTKMLEMLPEIPRDGTIEAAEKSLADAIEKL